MASDWLQLAWTQTWQVTALVVAVALLVRLAAANRPQLAYALWLVVFVKCITPPLWSSPSGAFCWLQTPRTCAEAHYIAAADDGDCRAGAGCYFPPLCFPPQDRGWRGRGRRVGGSKSKHRILAGS